MSQGARASRLLPLCFDISQIPGITRGTSPEHYKRRGESIVYAAVCRHYACKYCAPPSVPMQLRRTHRTAASQCNKCEKDGELIPEGQEIGALIFEFQCKCGNTYTVKCRRQDATNADPEYRITLQVNLCHTNIYIRRKTDKKHSCGRCHGQGI